MVLALKPATTFDEQLELLQKRGLVISNKPKARQVLSCLNYYTFTGYLHDFKVDGGRYHSGVTFERIYRIIEFDRRLRSVLMYAVELIEHTLKTKIAYDFAHCFGPEEYLSADIFKSKKEHRIFVKKLQQNISNNRSLPFVRHHINTYEGKLPIWVAIELFTMGMVHNFYKNMPTKNQKNIANEFNTGARQLVSWIENITYVRNLMAHYMRLYNFGLQKTPVKCRYNHKFWDPSHRVFDVVYVMKFLILDDPEWNDYVVQSIGAILLEYENEVELQCIGFPEQWADILRK